MIARGNRRGLTLLSVVLSASLGSLLMLGGVDLLLATQRAERRVDRTTDALERAARAHSWLTRDLQALAYHPLRAPIEVGPRSLGFLAYPPRAGDPWRAVEYRFEPATGDLIRRVEGEDERVLALGEGATVEFRQVESEGGVEFALEVPGAGGVLRLEGGKLVRIARSWDDFRAWNS